MQRPHQGSIWSPALHAALSRLSAASSKLSAAFCRHSTALPKGMREYIQVFLAENEINPRSIS